MSSTRLRTHPSFFFCASLSLRKVYAETEIETAVAVYQASSIKRKFSILTKFISTPIHACRKSTQESLPSRGSVSTPLVSTFLPLHPHPPLLYGSVDACLYLCVAPCPVDQSADGLNDAVAIASTISLARMARLLTTRSRSTGSKKGYKMSRWRSSKARCSSSTRIAEDVLHASICCEDAAFIGRTTTRDD